MKILLFGANGQLGSEFERAGLWQTDHHLTALNREQCDLTNFQQVSAVIDYYKPDIILNCAAYTAVDKAEQEPEVCYGVNRDAIGHLAHLCAQRVIPCIHFSTDYVFAGTHDKPYLENDPVSPLGIYGNSKYQGEQLLREHLPKHLIFRISWVNGIHGRNFLKTMLRLACERQELKIVDDQWGCPTFTKQIVKQVFGILPQLTNSAWGTYHLCQAPALTWYQFACAIIQEALKYQTLAVKEILPISSAEYPTPAKRPAYSVLNCQKFITTFDTKIDDWQTDLAQLIWEYYQ